ncbi:O-antigen ligase family protein [Roseimicrobium gellanilyticum]|nr:O-antigen ligase family protein [Roseimicrobium gellanilyticum]
MSLCYVLRPPSRSINRVLLGFLFAVPLLALLAFLPLSKTSVPFWRTALETEHGIALGGLVTPQPWITFEGWVALVLGIIWLIYCLGQNFKRQEIRVAIQFFALVIAILAVIAIGLFWFKREIPLWRGEWAQFAYFGPFPNRNHFGGLVAIGAVLGFAATFDAFQRKNPVMGCLYALGVVPMFVAMLLNTSRMGVLLFFAGLGLWMALANSKKYTRAWIAVALSILLILASGFIIFGSRILDRFHIGDGSIANIISSEGRIGIYLDTLRMINLSPWAGVGLGNFDPVFSMTRESIDTESRAIHPESDWLWLASEAGVPCILSSLVAAIILTFAYGPWGSRRIASSRGRRLGVTVGVAALIYPAQSLVDTPLHGIGPATFTALLIGLAGNRRLPDVEPTAKKTSALWPGLGIAICALGASLLVASLTGSAITPQEKFDQLANDAAFLKRSGDRAAALQTWNKAASIKPLQWNLYFERASLKLELGYSSQEALADFSRARYLEQTFGRMCMREAELWFLYDPPYGIPALREAILRDSTRAYGFYHWGITQMTTHPEVRQAMRSLATTPGLQFLYLSASTGTEFDSALKEFLVKHPTLEGLKPADRLRLFQLWYERGDPAEVLQRLEDNAEWRRDGWPVVAEHRAKQGDFEGAYTLAHVHLPKPSLRPLSGDQPTETLRRLFLLNPQDPLAGLELYWAQKAAGDFKGAQATLREVSVLKQVPPGVFWELAEVLAETGDYLHAWSALQEYARKLAPPP